MLKIKSSALGSAEMCLAMGFGGSSIIAGKILTGVVSIFTINFISLLAATITMAPAALKYRKEFKKMDKKQFLYAIFQALFGIIIFRIFMIIGLRYLKAGHAGLLTSSSPVILTIFSIVILKEKPTLSGLFALGLALAGLVLINSGQSEESGNTEIIGIICLLVSAVGEAFLTIFRKLAGGTIPSPLNAFILSLIGTIFFAPFCLIEFLSNKIGAIGTGQWLVLLYYGAAATGFAYILWGDGAIRISGNKTGIYMAMMPIASVTLSRLILSEHLENRQLIGGLIIVAAIILSEIKSISRIGKNKEKNIKTAVNRV